MVRVDSAQIISTRAVEIIGAGAAKAEDQFFRDAFDQTDADRQRMIDAANVLFGQMPNEVAQATLIDGAQLFQQDDGGQLQAILGVDVVVGGKFGFHAGFARNGSDNDRGAVFVPDIVLNDHDGTVTLLLRADAPVSDELCREYGLSVIEQPQQGRGKQYGEWRAEQEQRPTWRGLIRADIDEAIRQSMTERQFFDNLRKKGYEVKIGKDISVRPPGKKRFVRLIRNFGEDYSIEQIRRRILSQTRAEKKPSEPTRQVIRIRLFGSLKKTRKITGFRALYFHYCYLLGIFPKNKPKQNRRRLHFLLREDLRKLDDITAETRLLVRNRIDTAEQLFSYRDEIAALTAERKQLYKLQRTAAVKADPEKSAEIKDRISALSKELATLRKEVVLCNSIAERSGVIQEKIKAVREDEQPERKAKCDRTEQQKTVR